MSAHFAKFLESQVNSYRKNLRALNTVEWIPEQTV